MSYCSACVELRPASASTLQPDFATIGKGLLNDKNVTLELLWQEYKTAEPGG